MRKKHTGAPMFPGTPGGPIIPGSPLAPGSPRIPLDPVKPIKPCGPVSPGLPIRFILIVYLLVKYKIWFWIFFYVLHIIYYQVDQNFLDLPLILDNHDLPLILVNQ